ncbi:MAG: homocysteine S-methyltransferase family protein [Planctomycetaceae bacterium]
MSDFRTRLNSDVPLIMDGATGTELTRRGLELTPPLWSASAILQAPELLQQIHRDYVEAGAQLITANTFRTHARNLREAGFLHRAKGLTVRAVEIARTAGTEKYFVAGSIAPLEDCYSPQLTPSLGELEDEHAAHTEHLASAGVDCLLVETQITIREAVIAAKAATDTGLPVLVSFTLAELPGGARLLSGEPLQEAINAVTKLEIDGLLLNCIPAEDILPAVAQVTIPSCVALGAYANTGRLLANGSWVKTEAVNPAVYAVHAQAWKTSEIKLLGGCCGTTPEHVRQLAKAVYDL